MTPSDINYWITLFDDLPQMIKSNFSKDYKHYKDTAFLDPTLEQLIVFKEEKVTVIFNVLNDNAISKINDTDLGLDIKENKQVEKYYKMALKRAIDLGLHSNHVDNQLLKSQQTPLPSAPVVKL